MKKEEGKKPNFQSPNPKTEIKLATRQFEFHIKITFSFAVVVDAIRSDFETRTAWVLVLSGEFKQQVSHCLWLE